MCLLLWVGLSGLLGAVPVCLHFPASDWRATGSATARLLDAVISNLSLVVSPSIISSLNHENSEASIFQTQSKNLNIKRIERLHRKVLIWTLIKPSVQHLRAGPTTGYHQKHISDLWKKPSSQGPNWSQHFNLIGLTPVGTMTKHYH